MRPGSKIIDRSDNSSIVSYHPKTRQLSVITVNYDAPQRIEYDLSSLKRVGTRASLTVTHSDGSKLFQTSRLALTGKKLGIDAAAKSIYSLVVDDVAL